ncbi:hypothetical protein [Pseudomonas protegens]|uniref:hypothetical protein n=1 Tax=Pseudomonas protegens TaxID=380021 RepID=UPI001E5C9066|nr:hypothetical protein [Pseudomonas protegens]MCD9572173.1 hypothetical protein [Pseudomonas protegens]
MPEIKERPILFSAPMVRAILEGRKTVTRRPIKPSMRGFDVSFELHQQDDGSWRPMHTFDESCMDDQGTEHPIACPYGQPGDRLWVRETWGMQVRRYGGGTGEHIVYRATNPEAVYCKSAEGREYPVKWKPSIHMHRHSSRILLEITDVRVERLQEITPSQCIAEGAWRIEDKALGRGHEAVAAFKDLWQSTGGDWDANPWVWVVEFRRVQP